MSVPSVVLDIVAVAGTVVAFGIVLLGLYAGIVLLARGLHRFMPATSPGRDPALDALRARLAAGEIDEVEYERLRGVLRRG